MRRMAAYGVSVDDISSILETPLPALRLVPFTRATRSLTSCSAWILRSAMSEQLADSSSIPLADGSNIPLSQVADIDI